MPRICLQESYLQTCQQHLSMAGQHMSGGMPSGQGPLHFDRLISRLTVYDVFSPTWPEDCVKRSASSTHHKVHEYLACLCAG